MERIAVYVNDADLARHSLAPLLTSDAAPAQFLMVACPPAVPRRIHRWISSAGHEAWRQQWSQRLQRALQPLVDHAPAGVSFEWTLARGSLLGFAGQLRQQHGAGLQMLDARRARPGIALQPLVAGQRSDGRIAAPVVVTSALSLMLALAD